MPVGLLGFASIIKRVSLLTAFNILSKLIEKSLFVSTHLQLDFKLRASSSYSEKDGLGATTWVSVDKNAIYKSWIISSLPAPHTILSISTL